MHTLKRKEERKTQHKWNACNFSEIQVSKEQKENSSASL